MIGDQNPVIGDQFPVICMPDDRLLVECDTGLHPSSDHEIHKTIRITDRGPLMPDPPITDHGSQITDHRSQITNHLSPIPEPAANLSRASPVTRWMIQSLIGAAPSDL